MSERSPVGYLDIRLVEEKLIDESILQDYRKVHEKLERILERVAVPLDGAALLAIEEQFLAWLHVHEAKKDEDGRLTSLLRCGLAHVAVTLAADSANAAKAAAPAIDAVSAPVDSPLGLVDRAMTEFRARGWHERVFDAVAAEAAARKYAPLEKKSAPEVPATKRHLQAAGKAGARQRIQKEDSAMSDSMNTGAAPASPETPAVAPAKPKAVRKPRAAAPKAPAKKAAGVKAPAKKAAEKKVAAKAPAKKAAAKKAAAPKKAVAKKVAAPKKAAEKKVVAKKAAAPKKVAAKKPAAVKKVGAKKVAAPKKTVAKKPAAKKPVLKAAAAKKPAVKKVADKKPVKKVAAAKKPAAVKKAAAPKKAAPKKAAK